MGKTWQPYDAFPTREMAVATARDYQTSAPHHSVKVKHSISDGGERTPWVIFVIDRGWGAAPKKNPPLYDKPFRIDAKHTYTGKDTVYCEKSGDLEKHGNDEEGNIVCRLCGDLLAVKHVRAQNPKIMKNPTISPMLLAAQYVRKGMNTARATRRAFRELKTQAASIRRAYRGNPPRWTVYNTKIDTWFERDRSFVGLTDLHGEEIGEWWDDEVAQAVEEGFLNPRNWHASAVEYANYIGLTVRHPKKRVEKNPRVGNPTTRGAGTLARDHYRELLAQGIPPAKAEKMVRALLSHMGEDGGIPYFRSPNPSKSFVVSLRHDLGIVRIKTSARNKSEAVRIVCAAEKCPLSAVLKVESSPRQNPPHGGKGPVEIYGQTEKIFMKKTGGPYKGQKFVHTFKRGVKQIGLPAKTVIQTPDGQTTQIPKRTVLLQGKKDIWRNFQA